MLCVLLVSLCRPYSKMYRLLGKWVFKLNSCVLSSCYSCHWRHRRSVYEAEHLKVHLSTQIGKSRTLWTVTANLERFSMDTDLQQCFVFQNFSMRLWTQLQFGSSRDITSAVVHFVEKEDSGILRLWVTFGSSISHVHSSGTCEWCFAIGYFAERLGSEVHWTWDLHIDLRSSFCFQVECRNPMVGFQDLGTFNMNP